MLIVPFVDILANKLQSARVQHVTGHECVVTQHGIASVIPDSDETIAQTQIENQQFMDELNEWKLKAETELEERKRAEVMFRNLEVQIEELQTNNSFLEQELNRWKARTRCLEASATGCYHTVMEAVSQLLLTGVDGVLEF